MPGPFQVINSQPQDVRNKFLEGMPHMDNFPGPFEGLSPEQMKKYQNVQQRAVNNYGNISQVPLDIEASQYSVLNQGYPNCEALGGRIPMVPPIQSGLQPGPRYSPGIEYGNLPNRQGNTQEDFMNPMLHAAMANGYHQHSTGSNNKIEYIGLEGFQDDSITNPESQTGHGSIVPQFKEFPKCPAGENELLDIPNRPIEQFSHNNMVPYYGSKLTQNMAVTGQSQAGDNNICGKNTDGFANATPYRGKLELYTGMDEMWMDKRETGPLFSPAEQQTGWVFGTPAIRPDLDRYKTQVWKRHGEKPVESVKVGPGIGLDYTTPAQGGFQQYTRILPNNVSDYKANQLEGRVKGGSWFVSHPTSQYIHGVNQNNPTVEITQARRPTQAGKFMTSAPSADASRLTSFIPSTLKGKQARADTEQASGFGELSTYDYDSSGKMIKRENFEDPNGMPCVSFSSAPVGMTMKSMVPSSSQERTAYTSIRETFRRGDWKCLDKTQGQDKWGIIMGPAKGSGLGETREGVYVNYTDRGDVNPYVINATGLATQGGGIWSPTGYEQPARVTLKETTEYSYAGNASGSNMKNYVNTWSDTPNVTRKETTEYSYAGQIQNGNKGFYKSAWQEQAPKVTRKETTEYSHAGNVSKGGVASTNRDMFTGGVM